MPIIILHIIVRKHYYVRHVILHTIVIHDNFKNYSE
jgi:hypothetical protein